jgi:hypothetical protein
LRDVFEHEFVFKAEVPGHPRAGVVEISKDIWNVVITSASLVTIALESGMPRLSSNNRVSQPTQLTSQIWLGQGVVRQNYLTTIRWFFGVGNLSSISTHLQAYPMSLYSYPSHHPGRFQQFTLHLRLPSNPKDIDPSPGPSQQNLMAHLLTRPLVWKCPTYTGKQCEFYFESCLIGSSPLIFILQRESSLHNA